MLRRWCRYLAASGLVMAVVILVRRTLSLRSESRHVVPSPDPWRPIREAELLPTGFRRGAAGHTVPAVSDEVEGSLGDAAMATPPPVSVPRWLPPADDGSAPATHPIKAKSSSHIYHLPGMANYGRTHPDRWYADEESAQADGYSKAKR